MHRPPLRCKNDKYIDEMNPSEDRPLPDTTHFYDNRVSKLMAIEDATKEQSENAQIDRKDPNGLYHYVDPIRCRTDTSDPTKRRIKQCKSMADSILKDPESYNSYQLLLMEDGGNNLKQFVGSLDPTNVRETNDRLFHFWHQVPSMLRGLRDMQKGSDDREKLVHLDIKPENIVYNERPNHRHKLALIDFGLMHTFDKIKQNAPNNEFEYATFHWNFAPELYYYNKATFQKIGRMTDAQYKEYIQNFEIAVQHRTEINDGNQLHALFQKYSNSVYYFLRNMIPMGGPNASNTVIMKKSLFVLDSFKELLSHIRANSSQKQYDAFLTQAIPKIDVYGMGVSLAHVLTHTAPIFVHDNADIHAFVVKLLNIFTKMVNPNVLDRIDIGTALNEYEEVLRTDPAYTKWSRKHITSAPATISSSNIPSTVLSPSPVYWKQNTPNVKRKRVSTTPERPKHKVRPRTEQYSAAIAQGGYSGGRSRLTRKTHLR